MTNVVIVIGILIVILAFFLFDGILIHRENMSSLQCEGHCFDPNDVQSCCECLATGNTFSDSSGYQKRFRKCMCKKGYQNYCFIPVTNFLLSQ